MAQRERKSIRRLARTCAGDCTLAPAASKCSCPALFPGSVIMPLAVFALALAAFCIGSTEFIVSGILLHVSTDLGVTIPTAGLLVTGYAAGVAVGGPILGLL